MRLALYVFQRLLYLIPVCLGVLLVTFIIARVLPTDPVYLLVPPQDTTPETLARVRAELGLDQPLPVQFLDYIKGVASGNLGDAFHTGNPVWEDLRAKFPATFEITTLALIFCVLVSIPLGVISAVRRDGIVDHVSRVVSLAGIAMPQFWLALLLIYFLFYQFHWFPPPLGRAPVGFQVHQVTGLYTVDTLLAGDLPGFWEALKFMALPVLTLVLVNMAPLTRLTRSAMIDVLGSEYVRSARAAGVDERTINYRLALKNALLPPVTMIGQIYGNLLNGAVVVEIIFAWPGLGLYAVNAASQGDYAPVQAFALLAAGLRVIVFLATDLVYFVIDPRIRF
jgi:peptide/nickel transport system permease protein